MDLGLIDEDQQQVEAEALLLAVSSNRPARTLSKEIVCASLSTIGHNEKGGIVYTTINLTSLSLGDVNLLASYPFLQRIHVDGNQLTTLAPLADACSLICVTASHNKLGNDVIKCFISSMKTLEVLDLSFNEISSVAGLKQYSYLQELNLSHNCVPQILKGELGGMESFKTFDISNNNLSTIDPDAFAGSALQTLNVSLNELTDISFVVPLAQSLMWVDASDNNMMHFEQVQKLTKLATLLLAGNNTYDNSEILNLAKLPMLRELSLVGNPLCNLSHGINEPLDDDAGSDIVAPDELGPNTVSKLTITSSMNTSKKLTASPDSKNPKANNPNKTPEDEDTEEFAALPLEQQYRLTILWRVPNITLLDARIVTPQELTLANNLQGGADREKRSAARSKFLTAAGSAANTLRKARK